MHTAKCFLILLYLATLAACGGAQTPTSTSNSSSNNKNSASVISGQMLADGSVYITTANTVGPTKSTLLKDGSVYVVTPNK